MCIQGSITAAVVSVREALRDPIERQKVIDAMERARKVGLDMRKRSQVSWISEHT